VKKRKEEEEGKRKGDGQGFMGEGGNNTNVQGRKTRKVFNCQH